MAHWALGNFISTPTTPTKGAPTGGPQGSVYRPLSLPLYTKSWVYVSHSYTDNNQITLCCPPFGTQVSSYNTALQDPAPCNVYVDLCLVGLADQLTVTVPQVGHLPLYFCHYIFKTIIS